jgi:ABC-type nitrate/sulfonate/bicarbonate transport system substrate-binding protein
MNDHESSTSRALRRPRRVAIVSLTAVAALGLAACSSSTSSGSGASGSGGSGSKSVTVAMGNNSTPDMAYLPSEMAVQSLAGTYNVKKTVQFADDSTTLQALNNNTIQFTTESVPPFATAAAKLPNLVAIGSRANDQWDMIAKSNITDCTQLAGKPVGLFSKAGVSTAYVKLYFAKSCPNIKYSTIITPDSALRRQALEAGQLDATPLQATDAVQILNGPDKNKFHELATFANVLPGIGRDLVLTNRQTLKDHPDVVEAFLKAQVTDIRGFYANPTTIPGLMAKYLPGSVDPSMASQVADYFVGHKLFCANGGISDDSVTQSVKTFGQGGYLPTNTDPAKIVDDSAMKKVIAEIGPSTATTC